MRWTVPPAIVAIGIAATLHAQARPDFSGTYVLTPPADALAQDVEPLRIVVRQSAVELRVFRTTPSGESVFAYRLDGVETVESNMLGDVKVRAAWEGQALVVRKTRALAGPEGPVPVTTTETYAREGDDLAITVRRPTPDGGEGMQKTVYRRATR